jgi:hypothetical protein
MKRLYSVKEWVLSLSILMALSASSQTPTITVPGTCSGVIANFNTNDNGFNSPSVYGSIFDSSLYYNGPRGYWTDYLPPLRTTAPGAPRVMNIISPPYVNPNPTGTFNIGFYYIVNDPFVLDKFQVRIISVTQTPMGTVTNVEATSGVQSFATWSNPIPAPYNDLTSGAPNPTPFMGGWQGVVCLRLVDPDIVNASNTTFRVEISYLINNNFFAVFDNLSIGPSTIPLPVYFIGLVADRNAPASSVDLKWDVSEEIDVREYQVERSSNGGVYSTVGTIPARGKSIYAFTNYNVPEGTVLYRIRSVDIDGRAKYSGVLRLNGDNSYSDKMMIYPSPATTEITVQHKQLNRGGKITITSMDGKVVKTVTPTNRSSHTPIDISNLRPGMYFVRLDDGTGVVQTTKMMKN